MEFSSQYAAKVVQKFIGTTEPLTRLGGGISGFVFASPDFRTALKVHRTIEGYTTEVAVYKELVRLNITKICGLQLPRPRKRRNDLRLIQMDIVSPPFLLDFAGVLFEPPDFPEDVMEHWHEQNRNFFGPNVSIVYDVYNTLARHGLYYMDFRPSNLKLDGLPNLLPPGDNSEDDPTDFAN